MVLAVATLLALQAPPGRTPRAQQSAPAAPAQAQPAPPPGRAAPPAGSAGPRPNGTSPPAPQAGPPAVAPRRFGRFDLDQQKDQLARLPDLKECADLLLPASGHADCAVPRDPDRIARVQIAWEDSKPGGEIVALRLLFDPQLAPALTDLEWQLTRGWGAPVLEQLRREKDQKLFTLQWEDAEHRATVEAQGALAQPSRAVAVVLERRPAPLPAELAGLHPRPFPGVRLKLVRRLEWDGQAHAVVWGTSLSPGQEAVGEAGPAWATQRGYVGLWKLEPATAQRPRRWRAIWERVTGDEDEESSLTVSTYSYDRGTGAFVLAREERISRSAPPDR